MDDIRRLTNCNLGRQAERLPCSIISIIAEKCYIRTRNAEKPWLQLHMHCLALVIESRLEASRRWMPASMLRLVGSREKQCLCCSCKSCRCTRQMQSTAAPSAFAHAVQTYFRPMAALTH